MTNSQRRRHDLEALHMRKCMQDAAGIISKEPFFTVVIIAEKESRREYALSLLEEFYVGGLSVRQKESQAEDLLVVTGGLQ